MATADQFLPYVNPATPGCAEFERLMHVKDGIRAFCRESFAWRLREVALLTTAVAQESYTLTVLPTDAQLVAVHSAWANGCEMDVEEPGQADDAVPGLPSCRWVVGYESPTSVRVTPGPDAAAVVVTGTISLCPTDTAVSVPDWLFEHWRHAIAGYAIEKLCEQPGKAWSNPGRAALARTDFKAGVMLAGSREGPVRRKGLRVSIQDVPGFRSWIRK